jgi:hypothetical protein
MVDRLESNSAFELLFKLNHSFRFASENFASPKEVNVNSEKKEGRIQEQEIEREYFIFDQIVYVSFISCYHVLFF